MDKNYIESVNETIVNLENSLDHHKKILPAVVFINDNATTNPNINGLMREPYIDRIFISNAINFTYNNMPDRNEEFEKFMVGALLGPCNASAISYYIKTNLRDIILQQLLAFLNGFDFGEYNYPFQSFTTVHKDMIIPEIDNIICNYIESIISPLSVLFKNSTSFDYMDPYIFSILDGYTSPINACIELFDRIIETLIIEMYNYGGNSLDPYFKIFAEANEIDVDDASLEMKYTLCTSIMREIAERYIHKITEAKTLIMSTASSMMVNVIKEFEKSRIGVKNNDEQCSTRQTELPEGLEKAIINAIKSRKK